jgi:hypothetical protein
MSEAKTLGQKWQDFRPSKKVWLLSCVAAAAATVAVGFGPGGWVTPSTAESMAQNAATQARAKLIANACVERFASADKFANRFEEFKAASAYDRERMIEKGNWATLPGIEDPVPSAADRCADRVADLESPTRATPQGANDVKERS